MRPLKLEIQGLRSYVEKREIDFRDVSLMAIVGDTGAGKSSILEAMCFALYGSASWSGRAVRNLVSHGADAMEVRLRFEAGGHEWEVYRTAPRGSYPPARSSLICEALGEKLDRKKDVDARIVELVGLEYDAFLRCVILPQGRFQELLRATPADRARLLEGVFQLDVLGKVRAWAEEVLRERRPQLETLRVARAGLRGDPGAEAGAARAGLAELRARQQALQGAQARYREHGAVAGAAGARAAGIEALVARLDAAAVARTCADIDAVRAAGARIEAARKELAARRQEREAERDRLAAELSARARDRLDGDGLGRAAEALDRAEELITALEARRGEIAEHEAGVVAAREARDQAAARERAAGEGLEQARRADMAAHLAAGLAHGDACPVCAQALPAGFAAPGAPDLREAEAALERAGKALSKAEKALGKAEKALERARSKAEDDARALGRLRDDMPAALRPEVGADGVLAPGAIASRREALPALRAEVKAWEQQRAALEEELTELGKEATALDEQHTDEVRLRAHDLRKEVVGYARARAELAALLGREDAQAPAGHAEPAEAQAAPERAGMQALPERAGIDEIWAFARALAPEVDALLETAGARAAAARGEAEAAEARAREILDEIGCADAEEIARRLGGVENEIQRQEERQAEAEAEIEPARELDRRIATGSGYLDVVDEIRGLLAPGKLVAYAVERKQEALLTVASRLLGDMSAGRFGFSADFSVVDRRAGEARAAETLSGGETFLASLALALALVELAGRAGGRLEALFLDEGFGALDAEALDLAIEALVSQARRGRLVAVISHLRAVAESIDKVLYVEATPAGSDARWLDADERSALALDDAGLLG